MAKGREIPFWRTFVGTFGFFFSLKCLGRIGFWQTLLFLVILLVVAEEISEYLEVLNDNFLNFVLILLECLVLSPLAISIHRKILIDEKICAEFTFTKKTILYTFVAFIFSSYGILFSIVTDYFDSMDFIFSFPVFLLVTSILLGRISEFLPFLAIDDRKSLKECWLETRGNTIRIWSLNVFFGIFLFFIFSIATMAAMPYFLANFAMDGAMLSGDTIYMNALSIAGDVVTMVIVILYVVLLSHTCLELRARDDGGKPA